ncbi:DUF4270 family protein [Butyricimonas virosa]|uniref:DUF4270 family protein n=1 Tax=Butyricimonas virosa TaxID=544645 RepID=A0A412WW95_9BACT|nr:MULTISPECIES: DUF4270 family protein [Butyricimonas]MBS5624202.1 DUF4270 family protein [Porphyromonadaceae bacterium]MCI6414091.1 DUF4270 domain-containing protein [Butyricimonas virosa]MCI7162503.1 DUF4270 domain-containing protein [Butyricimonas virosa]MCI7294471.1 DUF4270 domain-containing protein [Butyricimonas virosa]MCI7390238.1 DUF4270 domain-containing protein [Butyricimonas virosa]
MRIVFLAGLLFVLYSCNNDLNTIGDTMVPAEGYVNIETFDIETSTVRLDSFPTSLNILSNMLESNQLTLGKMTDKTTGVTTATPYFQLIGSGNTGIPNYDDNYVYDSLTLVFPFNASTKILAGDTATLQTYRVYRLKNFPPTDFDDPSIYNNETLPLYAPEKPLATLSVKLEKQFFTQNNNERYFKLDDDLGRELFSLIRRQDSILDPNNALDFMRYFAGLTIVPDKDNMALLPIDGSGLSLRCHYHLDVNTGTYTFRPLAAYASGGYYAFTNIEHSPSVRFSNVSWNNPLPYSNENKAVIQGQNGYMLKMKLPFKSDVNPYRTILKVEIVLEPKIDNFEDIPEPTTIQVFTLDKYSRISGKLTDLSGNSVFGYLETNPNYKEDRKYRIDITDYYNSMVSNGTGGIDPELNLLIGLAGSPVQVGVDEINTFVGANNLTFQRLIVDKTPVLRIYYANY